MSTDVSSSKPNPTQQSVRKFLFERSFDGDLGLDFDEAERPKPTFTEEQLEDAKQAAFEEGRQAGLDQAREAEERKQTALMAAMDSKLAALMTEANAHYAAQLSNILEVAFVIARKVLPVYAAKQGMGEIEAIVDRVISEMGREPRLVIRIADSAFDLVKSRIDGIAAQHAYAGKIVVLGDDSMGSSDCRVEWADGGIERDFKKLWQEIDRIMESLATSNDETRETIAQLEVSQDSTQTSSGEQE